MPRLFLIAAAFMTLALPAQAEDKPAAVAWAMFTQHCTKFLTASTLAETRAAFRPHDTKIFATIDGAIQTGTAQIEDLGIPSVVGGYFQVSTTRLDGGLLRTCSLQMIGDADTSIPGLAAYVQEKAADILGADHSVQGGPVVTMDGPEGITLYLAAPGFPPEKAVQVLSTPRFSSISIETTTAE